MIFAVGSLLADGLKESLAKKRGVVLDVTVHQSIDSTNSWCMQQSKSGKSLPFACFAEEQTSGRGRRGKQWLMSSGSNIAMSLVWPFVLSEQSLQLLPISIALAIVETLEDLGLQQVQIKWPNDVYVQGKKIAGILIETQPVKEGRAEVSEPGAKPVAVVIGLGLNYDMQMSGLMAGGEKLVFTDICEQFKEQAVTIVPERNAVAADLLANVVAVCRDYRQTAAASLKKFRESYDYCGQKNVEIILDNAEVLSGVAQGVNEEAELLVLIDGRQRAFNSAEVSVRADA